MQSRYRFTCAWLPDGWHRNVVISVDPGGDIVDVSRDDTVTAARTINGAAIPGMPNIHSHAFQRAMAGLAEQRGGKVDQTLLLRALADRLRSREKLGWFVSEALLRMALLGTAIGFILMLIPISQLDSFEADTLRKALAGMTGGMAVALNVTVTGIATALILKLEYYFLDQAVAELFDLVTEVTEIHVIPTLEQGSNG